MKKIFVLFVLALAVLAGFPAMAETQSRSGGYAQVYRDAIGRGGYGRGYPVRQDRYGYGGYYDPAYLEQMFKLPESLLACQMNFGDKNVEKCHTLLKSVNYMEGHAVRHEDLNEIYGTFRIYKKGQYFCPFDDTDHRIGRGGATAVGAGTGAVIGGAIDGRRGAGIGAGAGAFASWWASRKSNSVDKCLEIVGKPQAAESEQEAPTVSYVEQGTQSNTVEVVESRDESHGPAYHFGPHPLANASRVYVDVYDGDRKPENFVGTMESGDSWDLARPRNHYRGWAQVPNEKGSFDAEELGREVNPTGWTFIEPAAARGR